MSLKPGFRDVAWMTCGAAALAAALAVAVHFDDRPDAADALAAHARKLELVDQMRVALASATASELGAVLGASDEHSQRFADEARAALSELQADRLELEGLTRTGGQAEEAALLGTFGTAVTTLLQVDEELLDLATRNSNVKAAALARGPLAEVSAEMRRDLAGLAAAESPDRAQAEAQAHAHAAELAALRVQAALPVHVAEASDEVMDRMEAELARDAEALRKALADLRALPGPAASAELPAAEAAAGRFLAQQAEILRLSRENTNVRSLALALDRRQAAMVASQQALDALREAIAAEPIGEVRVAWPR